MRPKNSKDPDEKSPNQKFLDGIDDLIGRTGIYSKR